MITVVCNFCRKTINTYTDPRRRDDDNHIVYVHECYCDSCYQKLLKYYEEDDKIKQ